jgi:hypothetical protein
VVLLRLSWRTTAPQSRVRQRYHVVRVRDAKISRIDAYESVRAAHRAYRADH